jgi:hypothetical protein
MRKQGSEAEGFAQSQDLESHELLDALPSVWRGCGECAGSPERKLRPEPEGMCGIGPLPLKSAPACCIEPARSTLGLELAAENRDRIEPEPKHAIP